MMKARGDSIVVNMELITIWWRQCTGGHPPSIQTTWGSFAKNTADNFDARYVIMAIIKNILIMVLIMVVITAILLPIFTYLSVCYWP